jgi:tetratricopeptide (TPR) repeat protein
MNIAESIVEDAAKKAGFEQTLKVIKNFWKTFKAQKTSVMQAEEAVAQHKEDDLRYYLSIFKSLADEFKERSFVLLFDQFEYVGNASTDFFLNFVKLVTPQERFHIIVSFKTDDTIWNDPAARKLYEDLERKLTHDLDGKKISILGLSVEDIDKWIKLVRGISLPLLDLQNIREYSAGLPLILDEWIRTSENLNDYRKINRADLCSQIIMLQTGLEKEDKVRLNRMSILYQPLKPIKLAKYLKMDDNVDFIMPFIKQLIENRIFDENFRWFRHELVQKCFQDDIDDEVKRSYHEYAVKFFEGLQEEERKDQETYAISKSYAYHLHKAGGKYSEKSLVYNRELAKYASKIGDLIAAERCYKRAIDDAKYLGRTQDEMDCLLNTTNDVYYVWGRYEEALSNYQRLLDYYDTINDYVMRAAVLNNIAMIHYKKAEYEQAMHMYNQSLEISKKIGDQQAIAYTLNNIAMIHYKKAEYEQAMHMYNQSLEISKILCTLRLCSIYSS